jgi:hypothetical protein
MIEEREVTIYEIVGRKVGQSRHGHGRPKSQLKENETYRILQVIPPNTLTLRECWEQEQDWAVTLGYPPEHEGTWKLLVLSLTDHPSNNPVSRAKIVANTDWEALIQKVAATKADPVWKETVGKSATAKALASRDYEEIGRKASETKADPVWKETVGVQAIAKSVASRDYEEIGRKATERQMDPEWRARTWKTCPHCGKGPMDPRNYARYHGNKCKKVFTSPDP